MNLEMDSKPALSQDDPLRLHLSGLPTPPGSAALWSRIEGTQRRRRLQRRLLVTGAVAGLAVIAALNLPMLDQRQATESLAGSQPRAAIQPDLRAIDHQLQAAYDQAADPEQIKALWLAREHAANSAATRSIEDDRIVRL